MELPYVLSDRWAYALIWIGVVSYFSAVITYVSKFVFHQIVFSLDNLVIYGFLLLGFSILFVGTLKKAIEVQKDRKDMEKPEFFFSTQARMGWACLVIHFLSLYTFSHTTYLYYPFALVAYLLLTMSQQVGTYLLVIFYIFSITRVFFTSTISATYGIQKILSMIYVGGYGYIFAKQYFMRRKQRLEDAKNADKSKSEPNKEKTI